MPTSRSRKRWRRGRPKSLPSPDSRKTRGSGPPGSLFFLRTSMPSKGRPWHPPTSLPISATMCGRVVQASDPLRFAFVDGLDVPDGRAKLPSYNVAPSQLLYVIRGNHETSRRTLELLRWGLIPHGSSDPEGGRKPIKARAESVARVPTFRAAYAKRRCIVPVDCFFEWRAVKGARAKPALRCRDARPHTVRYWRCVGELASSAKRRMDSHGGNHHRAVERAGRANPRSHAADPAEGLLRSLARRRVRSPRSARAVSGGTHGHVAGLGARQQAGKRRCFAARPSRLIPGSRLQATFYVRKGIQIAHSNEPLECRLSAKNGLELAGSSDETKAKADH